MATLSDLISRAEKLDVQIVAVQALTDTKDEIAGFNLEQLDAGTRSDDSEITPFYAPLTIRIKEEKGQPTDRVTLKDTGAFYSGVNVKIDGNYVITDSSDSKTEELKAKYGEDIFGLNTQYKIEYVETKLQPSFIRKIKAALSL